MEDNQAYYFKLCPSKYFIDEGRGSISFEFNEANKIKNQYGFDINFTMLINEFIKFANKHKLTQNDMDDLVIELKVDTQNKLKILDINSAKVEVPITNQDLVNLNEIIDFDVLNKNLGLINKVYKTYYDNSNSLVDKDFGEEIRKEFEEHHKKFKTSILGITSMLSNFE